VSRRSLPGFGLRAAFGARSVRGGSALDSAAMPRADASIEGAPASAAYREALARLRALGFSDAGATVLADHFEDAERRGKRGHGYVRLDWLETQAFDPLARPERVLAGDGFERWHGNGALGYLVLDAVCEHTIVAPPAHARIVVLEACFPTGVLGYWVRRLADAGLVAMLTATSPRRLPHPDGGVPLTGTNPLAIAIPSSDGRPFVTDVSMGAVTHGDVLSGRARPEDLVPFGGESAHKAFALAAGLELLVGALAGEEHGAMLVVARPDADPLPAFRLRAAGRRLPGDS
jgi:LDH2 family malate/lactate/ureidoglycolate dehydrogenase